MGHVEADPDWPSGIPSELSVGWARNQIRIKEPKQFGLFAKLNIDMTIHKNIQSVMRKFGQTL